MRKEFDFVIKNLRVNDYSGKIDKKFIHKITGFLKNVLHFEISSLIINFISAGRITEINKEYLKHNYSTDIITFNYSGNNSLFDGEIFISVDDAEFNSRKYNVSFNHEILRLVIHGFLHLIGYNDEKREEKIIMKRIENRLVKEFKGINSKNN